MKRIAATPSRAEQVYRTIRNSICDGQLESGTHLVQEEIAARLGVSRQPVQQAMALLRNDGLVLELGARGLHVAPLDAAKTVQHYQIRTALDQLAARLTAERAAASPEFAAELMREGERLLEKGDQALTGNRYRDAVAHDVAFHSWIYEKSGNPMIAATAETHWLYLRRVMVAVLNYAERGPVVWDQHHEILKMLAQGRVDAVVDLVRDHINGAQEALLQCLAPAADNDASADAGLQAAR